ncbi:MAG: flagellar basal body rod protein FlgB [Labilithrix sp.]|nr:flagellar basal body rod protein FlgB [Labilithrix sp.]MCW5817661.1 flagellar basal body rod protein FlgB [Labilithrix sp.]
MALLDSVEHLRGALDYHLDRHNLLTSNLAHIDTPGYKPVDLERNVNFAGQLHVAMAATNAGTSIGATPGGEIHGKVIEDPGAAAGGDENGVDLDREAVKIASNQMRYDMLAQLASSELASLAWAASDGKHG